MDNNGFLETVRSKQATVTWLIILVQPLLDQSTMTVGSRWNKSPKPIASGLFNGVLDPVTLCITDPRQYQLQFQQELGVRGGIRASD